jgi:hypothetical protein
MSTGTPVSLMTKLNRLEGLMDTTKITDWENNFLKSMIPTMKERAALGQVVRLTEKQQKVVDDLFDTHYAA